MNPNELHARAQQAVFDAPDGLTRLYALPFGDVPGSVFATIRAGDLYSHAWDLATAIGVDTDLDREVGEAGARRHRTVPGRGAARGGQAVRRRAAVPSRPPGRDRVAAFVGRRVS